MSWSGGKDSVFALYKLLLSDDYCVTSLHTVFNEETKRVGMHGVSEQLIRKQAEALSIPVIPVYLKSSDDHDRYVKLMTTFYERISDQVDGIAFGDIFLKDLKVFREGLLKPSGLEGIFPLWGVDTSVLMREFIQAGFKTVLCAADIRYFSKAQMGTVIDAEFFRSLPSDVDPCGENGEFHTFVYDGPVFNTPVSLKSGDVVEKRYFYQVKNKQGVTEKMESAFWFQDLFF